VLRYEPLVQQVPDELAHHFWLATAYRANPGKGARRQLSSKPSPKRSRRPRRTISSGRLRCCCSIERRPHDLGLTYIYVLARGALLRRRSRRPARSAPTSHGPERIGDLPKELGGRCRLSADFTHRRWLGWPRLGMRSRLPSPARGGSCARGTSEEQPAPPAKARTKPTARPASADLKAPVRAGLQAAFGRMRGHGEVPDLHDVSSGLLCTTLAATLHRERANRRVGARTRRRRGRSRASCGRPARLPMYPLRAGRSGRAAGQDSSRWAAVIKTNQDKSRQIRIIAIAGPRADLSRASGR